MKIRKGFVTNSSSYSSAVIRIQSKELMDLLKQYEKLFQGAFHDVSIRESTFCVDQDEFADEWQTVPETLGNVLDSLMNGLSGYRMKTDEENTSRKKLLSQIKAQKQKLTDSIQKVSWEFQDDSGGEFEVDGARVRTFTYDRENGGDGTYEESDRDDFAEFDFDEDE